MVTPKSSIWSSDPYNALRNDLCFPLLRDFYKFQLIYQT